MRKLLVISMVWIGLVPMVWGQDPETGSESAPFTVQEGTEVSLGLGVEKEEEGEAPKPRRNEYYGYRTKPMYTTRGQGTGLVREHFFYLKEYIEPNSYVQDVYWYDFRKGAIVSRKTIDPEFAGVLHGPYQRFVGDSLVEEGNYYLGVKHGRWVEYDRDGILLDKTKYFKGWLKESKLSYYDNRGQKVKEVIPMEYGEKNGMYYYFHLNGLIAVQGEYLYGQKVGVWREYYGHRRQIKREIQYAPRNDPWAMEDGFTPYIIREYDRRGQLIYDRERYERSLEVRRR